MTSDPGGRALALAERPWPEVPRGCTVLVPLGSLEQHGPHLPLDTDTVIAAAFAAAVADELSARDDAVLVAPALAYGASGEHQPFAGTVSIGHDALALMLTELIRSLSTWAGRVVLVNGHGGNMPTVQAVVARMRLEEHDVSWVPCAFESASDAHAGHDETSMMLHLAPWQVRMSRAEAGNTRPLQALLPTLTTGGVAAVSPNGVLGDPTRASAELGRERFEANVRLLVRCVADGSADEHGQLRTERVDHAG